MKFKKRIENTKRGYRILGKYCPGLISSKVLKSAAETLTPFVTIWFSARIINELSGERNTTRLAIYVILTIGINFLLSMIKNALEKKVNDKESGMWNYFSKIFADKQMTMDFSDLENPETQKKKQKAEENLFMFGNGLGQLVWDTAGLISVFIGIIASVILTAPLFLSKTGETFMDSPLWIVLLILILILAGWVTAGLRAKEDGLFQKWTDSNVWFNRAFMFYGHELYSNMGRAKDVRIYRQDRIAERERRKLQERNDDNDKYIRKMSSCQGMHVLFRGTIGCLCYLFVVAKAGLGAFAVGSIVQYVGALIKLVESFGNLSEVISENKIYTEHLEKLYEYLDLPDRKKKGTLHIKNDVSDSNIPERINCEIEFKNVSFKYPGTDDYVLKNINTKLNIRKKQAFVGANGAGKTTFIKLLCGLYEPTEGQILLNGRNIREYDYSEYLKFFSFVFQDFKLLAFPLGQNIAADITYDRKKAEDCLGKASFTDRLKTMSDGLETYLYKDVSEKGIQISGGEAQKIALARALYKDSPIIVLDEPTAALDPIAEEEIYRNFDNIVKDKTAIYISHRLSSCQFCDEITVFDKGEIIQKGKHVDLLKDTLGKYAQLWNAQAKYYQNA
ncbi:MAG: ABC transporter ATP-binding protein/permease [Lachnospiraceae bacterium]|nr:ABC transporter ATP-binding protein/permease [Lachnospiraceae bacterium]